MQQLAAASISGGMNARVLEPSSSLPARVGRPSAAPQRITPSPAGQCFVLSPAGQRSTPASAGQRFALSSAQQRSTRASPGQRTAPSSAEQRARAVWFRAASDPARRQELLATLYAAHRSAVLAFARRLGATRDADAEDICADVFVVALKRVSTFRGQSTPRTWLLGITLRLVADRRKSATSRREVLLGSQPDRGSVEDTESLVLEAERQAQLRRAVGELPAHQRAAVTGYHLDEAPMAAVARAAHVPLQTAYARLYAGQAQLRARLAAVG